MSFKLLAIRPLSGTAPVLLKGLKENLIYSFYNEYKFFSEDNKETGNSDEYAEIESIQYNPIVPVNLYGDNINISAIVGQNGSGKSSLMELFYYATLISNQDHISIGTKNIKGIEGSCCIEIILLKDGENIEIINVSHDSNGTNINSIFYAVNGDNVSKFNKVDNTVNKKVAFDFYSNIINYSIYGLNSVTLPWLEHIFHKNDGYQLPIVISPFKEHGNYDINNEYLLMQSRAIFYSKILGFNELIDNVFIEDVHFEIKLNNILKIRGENKLTLDFFKYFLSITGISEESFNKLIFNEDIQLFSLDSIKNNMLIASFYESVHEDGILDINKNGLLTEIDFYKSLVYLYIFKKLYKISLNYKKYRKFHFLFSEKLSFDLYFNNREVSKNLRKMDPNMPEKIIRGDIFEYLMLELDLVANDVNVSLSDEDLFSIKSAFMGYYEIRLINSPISKELNAYEYDEFNILNNIEPTRQIILDLFKGKEFRAYWFMKYVTELNNDTSHITFKLNQAKNYFKNDIFQSIEVDKSILLNNDNEFSVKISIKNDYLLNNNGIEAIPLAVFEHSIKVVKTDVKNSQERSKLIKDEVLNPFLYTSLSSGEQHLMNSMLTIAYHIYNLLSVNEESDLIKYKNINLIFDELELYLHPEYQRRYISNLINLLNRIGDITSVDKVNYNIMMVTHSPFILSDIPSENILKLENGVPNTNDSVNSFASNIYDLLKDEFFLKDGAIGAYASNLIKKILEKDIISQEDANVIDLIGDPFLKGVAKKKIEESTSIDILEVQIKKLQTLLEQEKIKNVKNKGI